MPHLTTLDVRFSELDPYGHVNHAVYVSYFEVARTEALAHCEIPLETLVERGYQIVVTTIEVRYLRSAGSSDRLTIETSLSELRRASTVWQQRILRGDEVLVTATVTAAVTKGGGKPVKPPPWLFPALQPLLD